MRKMLRTSASMLVFVLGLSSAGWASEAIAVWATPDSMIASNVLHLGVVAYHNGGIDHIDFSVNQGPARSIRKETFDPDTNEYEYVFPLDTTAFADGSTLTVRATAYPRNGEPHTLSDRTVFVNNHPQYKTWYVDGSLGSDQSGDGSANAPFQTIARALGTEHARPEPHARNGDTVIVRSGTNQLPEGQYGDFTSYVTIMAEPSGSVMIEGGGVLRTPFLKFVGFQFRKGGVYTYTHHIWMKDCTYTGYGQIWADTIDRDEAFRSRPPSSSVPNPGYVTVENFSVHDANQGISLISSGNHIIRQCHVYNQNGDGLKFQGDEVLVTGNIVHDVKGPTAWSVAKNNGPYDFTGKESYLIHVSTDYGKTWPEELSFSSDLAGSNNTSADVVSQLNADAAFASHGFQAQLSPDPYPYPGRVMILQAVHREQVQFYVEGPANTVLNLSDNARDLNDISLPHPAKNSTDHNDGMANDAGNSTAVVIRNNRFYALSSQGIKFDGIARDGLDLNFTKRNVAIINNELTGRPDSARMLYFNAKGSTTRSDKVQSILHYDNVLIAHNTLHRTEESVVRNPFSIDTSNPFINDFFVINNIIGAYSDGDFPLSVSNKGVSDYNVFFPSKHGKVLLNTNSVKGDPAYLDIAAWDFKLNGNSPALGRANPNAHIAYDLLWRVRNPNPEAGAYEYDPVAAIPDDDTAGNGIPPLSVGLFINVFNPTRSEQITIPYTVNQNTHIKFSIHDRHGREVITLLDDELAPTTDTVEWKGQNESGAIVASGVYVLKIKAGNVTQTKKVVVMK